MRNSDSKKLITNLVTATVVSMLTISVMPEIRCETGDCVPSKGDICFDGSKIKRGYKMVIGHIG